MEALGRKHMEDSKIEWHRSRFSDIALAVIWSFVVVSLSIFALLVSDILAVLYFSIFIVFWVLVATITMYDRTPYLVGIAEDRIVFRHRYRFRKAKYQEVAWPEITRLDFKRPKGAIKILYTVEGPRGLMIPEEAADQIERLWRRRKGDLETEEEERS